MENRSPTSVTLLLAVGLLAFVLAGLSIVDMFRSRPDDGVVLDPDAGKLLVSQVVPGSGAARAGIRPGHQIRGIGRTILRDPAHAAEILNGYRIGDRALYLIHTEAGLREVEVELGQRRLGRGTYLLTTALGFTFFLVGLFVFLRQPTLRVSQVYFLLSNLFLLFLVCRMRPPSYSWIDMVVLEIGTLAFLVLPAAFFHFYLLFPRPAWLDAARDGEASGAALAALWRRGWMALYLLPPLVFTLCVVVFDRREERLFGIPAANWWLLGLYMVLGIVALGANARRLDDRREKRGVVLVLFGSIFGALPFLVASVGFADSRYSTPFFLLGVMPLALVPITFAYSIVRFQLFDIRVILRRSLLYTVITALVTGIYAGGIAAFSAIFRDAELRYFPIVFALAIVVLFDPLRRRLQDWIDRSFFAGRSRLQRAMVELGEALAAQVDLTAVVQELVAKLPQLLGVRFAALYLMREGRCVRVAGPDELPTELDVPPEMLRHLRRRTRLTRLDQMGPLRLRSAETATLLEILEQRGAAVLAELSTPRRDIGLAVLSDKIGRVALDTEEMKLVQGLLHQVSLALETSLLLDERTTRAELERELEIAASIQARLLPDTLHFAEGWNVAAVCRPARIVGGDFFAQLPAPHFALSSSGEGGLIEAPPPGNAIIYGDVSGKSVSGALMMMAAHEALHALAMTQPQPNELFNLANRRIYGLGRRSFVALGYFHALGNRLLYLVAGQPPPILRRRSGEVFELPLPDHRLPIGALYDSHYDALAIELEPGDVVVGYSDGITDARSHTGEDFGTERLMDAIAAAPADPDTIVRSVIDAVEDLRRGAAQYDDLTLVAVGRRLES